MCFEHRSTEVFGKQYNKTSQTSGGSVESVWGAIKRGRTEFFIKTGFPWRQIRSTSISHGRHTGGLAGTEFTEMAQLWVETISANSWIQEIEICSIFTSIRHCPLIYHTYIDSYYADASRCRDRQTDARTQMHRVHYFTIDTHAYIYRSLAFIQYIKFFWNYGLLIQDQTPKWLPIVNIHI